MRPSYSRFPLADLQVAEAALAAEVQLLGSAFITAMKVLESALVASTQPSPFTLENVKLPDGSKLAANSCRILAHSLNLIQTFLRRQLAGEKPFRITPPLSMTRPFLGLLPRLFSDSTVLIEAQSRYWRQALDLWQAVSLRLLGEKADPAVRPAPGDKRFRDAVWAENALFDWIKQFYLLTARHFYYLFTQVEDLDPKTAEKIEFYTRQWLDALSPTNFPLTNPEVIQTTLETGGENLVQGLANLLEDLDRGNGRLRLTQTDPEAFEPGRNLATTPGKVIYQTELMQLLQYQPTTESVYQRPLLIVPPWINKYYILDLQPKNSFIQWAVAQGFTVFVISWVNPDARLAEKNFEHYLAEGTLAALEAIQQATGEREVNAIGYCIGGTLLFCTLAYLAAIQEPRLRSATALTTLIDFTEVGELGVFIDEEQLARLDKKMEKQGYLAGAHMAQVFNQLRANDLIWSSMIHRYLLGEDPFPFDLLYWNSDATRMPKAMHHFYLHQMYLENRLKEPGGISLLGIPLDLGRIEIPVYFLATQEDHIAPWRSVYAGAHLPAGPVTFVLGESGHIAGVINPPAARKYGYRTQAELPATADTWLEKTTRQPGSWWMHWLDWIQPYAGPKGRARVPGDGGLQPLEAAPGSYVKVAGIE
ncbi:MAG: class I poly(R)-hydroxyalkanoic acid synthase [Candidatus Competibacteraceae bacterium]